MHGYEIPRFCHSSRNIYESLQSEIYKSLIRPHFRNQEPTDTKVQLTKSVIVRMKNKTTKIPNSEESGPNGKFKSSNTSNQWISTVLFLTWYMQFLMKKMFN